MEFILWVSYGYPMGILWYSLVIGRLQSRYYYVNGSLRVGKRNRGAPKRSSAEFNFGYLINELVHQER